jgi:hypothetical protein
VQLAEAAAGGVHLVEAIEELGERQFRAGPGLRGPGQRLDFRPVVVLPNLEDAI